MARAGRETNAIVAALNQFYKTVPGDPSVAVAGLPAQINGAYACLNAIDSMTNIHSQRATCTIANRWMIQIASAVRLFETLDQSVRRYSQSDALELEDNSLRQA